MRASNARPYGHHVVGGRGRRPLRAKSKIVITARYLRGASSLPIVLAGERGFPWGGGFKGINIHPATPQSPAVTAPL